MFNIIALGLALLAGCLFAPFLLIGFACFLAAFMAWEWLGDYLDRD